MISDIRHQGRAKSVEIIDALRQADPLAALLSLDRHRFPERIATLSREMAALRADGTLGTTMYDATARDLVPR